MDNAKKAAFVKAMGRQKFAKGGMAKKMLPKRRYLDDGGNVTKLGGPGDVGVHGNATNPNTGILGSVGSALGLNNNFQASGANIQAGTNQGQLNQAYTGVQGGLAGQQALASTLAPQAPGAVANQQALANQYLAMSQGQGPNPALAQLAQATGKNVANQAALMAGQRGASGNVGLIARQAAQQGAQTQQDAAGQAATLQAEQQIAAQQNLANLSGNQIAQAGQAATGLSSAQQNEQGILQGANTAANNAAVGMQSNINNTNAQTSAGNQGMAGNILGGITSAASSLFGGGGASGLFGGKGLAKGGEVGMDHHLKLAEMNAHSLGYAGGGPIQQNPLIGEHVNPIAAPSWGNFTPTMQTSSEGPHIEAMQALPKSTENFSKDVMDLSNAIKKPKNEDWGPDSDADLEALLAHGGEIDPMHFHKYFAKGGAVPAMVSPGEVYLSPDKVSAVVNDGADPMKIGEKIPGKASKKNDSYANDTVPKTLQEGGVVIPRHITTHKMRKDKAALFVHRAVAKKKVRS